MKITKEGMEFKNRNEMFLALHLVIWVTILTGIALVIAITKHL